MDPARKTTPNLYKRKKIDPISFLMRKRPYDIDINSIDISNQNNKIEVLKKISQSRNKNEDVITGEKHKKLLESLEKIEIGASINAKTFEEITELKNATNIFLFQKNKFGYYISYNIDKDQRTIYIYKVPKLIGKFHNNSLTVNICYSDAQIRKIIPNPNNENYEKFALSKDGKRVITKKVNSLESKEILYIFNDVNDFNLESLEKKPLFVMDNSLSQTKIEPISINRGFFYYFSIPPLFRKKYSFIKTKKREKFLEKLGDFISWPEVNTFYLTGPRGIGKSVTLIYFSSLNIFHIFYINLELILEQKVEISRKILKYEIIRFFGNSYDSIDNNHKKNIDNFINGFSLENLQKFFISIINVFKEVYDRNKPKILIFDNYSEDIKGFNLDDFLSNENFNNNFKFIISLSLGNYITKIGIENSLEYNEEAKLEINFFSNFFDESETSLLLENSEDEQIKNSLKKYGNIPSFYYILKNNNNINQINEAIVKDLKQYINNDISKLIEIIMLIRNDYIFQSNDIKKIIDNFILKYISLKKKRIYYKLNERNNKYEYYSDKEQKQKINVSKIYEKFLIFYIQNDHDHEELELNLEQNFSLDDFSQNLLAFEYNPKKNLSEKLFKKFYEKIYQFKIKNIEKKSGYINIYKLDFLFPFIEIIFYRIIYEFVQNSMKNLKDIINLATEGGIFEILVIYDIIYKQKFNNITIDNYTQINSLIPVNYSLKFFSYKQRQNSINKGKKKNMHYNLSEIIKKNNSNKINLENKPILILQRNSNGKYYDAAILIPSNNNNNELKEKKKFIMILLQITIKKNRQKYFTDKEHEINFTFVKRHLENIYNIEIESGYFYYILKKENNVIFDMNTYNKNKGKCILFDLSKGIDTDIQLFNDNSFITNKFLIFNECSLLKNENNLNALFKIKNMVKNEYKQLNLDLFSILSNSLQNIDEKIILSIEQFHIIGNEDMSNSIHSTTSFFIFIKNQKK